MITIYTDGSSIGNPGPGGWGAIVWYPEGRVKELGGREDHSTNNRMELTSAIEALEHVFSAGQLVTVFTDSSYLVNGITKWVHGWQKNGWITGAKEPVLNKELWEELFALTRKVKTEWKYAPGHAGVPGNERVDAIAQGYARGENIELFDGEYEKYGIDLTPKEYEKKSRSGKAYSYLSLIDGKAMRHATWDECKKRVEGVTGAKYKKALSVEDEKKILAEWGVSI
jgi:ribonuclease HI